MDPIQNKQPLENLDLSAGINGLINGILYQNPEMNMTEVETIANALLGQMGDALNNGQVLGSVTFRSDGGFDISLWHIGPNVEG